MQVDLLRDAIIDAMDGSTDRYKPGRAPAACRSDVIARYVVGDPYSRYAAPLDVLGARADVASAASRMIQGAPDTDKALIANVGLFFSSDAGAMQAGCLLMVDTVTMALSKHRTVDVVISIGGHDHNSSTMLSAFLGVYFRGEDRVAIEPMARYGGPVPKLTSIDGGKPGVDATRVEFTPKAVFCKECGGGLFAWKVDANNEKNHIMICAVCQEYYPILDLTDIFGLIEAVNNECPEGEDKD